jgi:hypothetical protein
VSEQTSHPPHVSPTNQSDYPQLPISKTRARSQSEQKKTRAESLTPTTPKQINYAKFATVAGLASAASARELMRVTKNKLKDE